jgi:hypothetical protein
VRLHRRTDPGGARQMAEMDDDGNGTVEFSEFADW